jgi:bifunctional non-homologous end joining protein LigD
MAYYVFDLLYLDGYDLRAVPLYQRKQALQELLAEAGSVQPIILSEHFDTAGAGLLKQACDMGLEGIVSKFKGAPYKSERNESWVKVKCLQTGRYEVIGYKKGATSLYLAKREGKDLIYVGKAGTGFTNTMILELAGLLRPITVEKMPLAKKPDRKNKIDYWATPKYWAGLSTVTSPRTVCCGTPLSGDCTPAKMRKSRSFPNSADKEAVPRAATKLRGRSAAMETSHTIESGYR